MQTNRLRQLIAVATAENNQVLTSVYSISVPLRPFSRLRNHILVVPSGEYGPYPRITLSLVRQTPTRKPSPEDANKGQGSSVVVDTGIRSLVWFGLFVCFFFLPSRMVVGVTPVPSHKPELQWLPAAQTSRSASNAYICKWLYSTAACVMQTAAPLPAGTVHNTCIQSTPIDFAGYNLFFPFWLRSGAGSVFVV